MYIKYFNKINIAVAIGLSLMIITNASANTDPTPHHWVKLFPPGYTHVLDFESNSNLTKQATADCTITDTSGNHADYSSIDIEYSNHYSKYAKLQVQNIYPAGSDPASGIYRTYEFKITVTPLNSYKGWIGYSFDFLNTKFNKYDAPPILMTCNSTYAQIHSPT